MKRLHVHLKVKDLDAAASFYEAMLGAPPDLRADDYAKWLLNDPAAHISLSTHGSELDGAETGAGQSPKNPIDHAGISFDTDEMLEEAASRLADKGYKFRKEDAATCCYARSNKVWATSPDGAIWELFHTYDAHPTYGAEPPRTAVGAITPPAARDKPAPLKNAPLAHRPSMNCC